MTEQWRPISEAPKDETDILGTTGGKIPYVMSWDVTDECWVTFNRGYESIVEPRTRKQWVPSHWMPLPAPPEKDR